MTRITCLAIALSFALAGCGTVRPSKFQCPHPDGVSCMSTLEVYEASLSRHGPSASDPRRTAPAPSPSRAAAPRQPAGPAVIVEEDGGSLRLVSHTVETPVPVAPSAPLRTDPQVLRIWLAPWEDTRGDLHLPGYVYSEIVGRTWAVGERAPTPRSTLRLLEPASPTASASN